MFLKAGALSLALLLASRLLGLLRESAQAAAFGTSGLGDVAVLMLTLPDWLTSVLASGALAYVLLPHWAGQKPDQQAQTQRRVANWLLGLGASTGLLLYFFQAPVIHLLASGLPPRLLPQAAQGLAWSAAAVPTALLAALWATRLQHERDFTGLYAANLVVNCTLIGALYFVAKNVLPISAIGLLGGSLWLAMGLRLLWLRSRLRAYHIKDETPIGEIAVPLPRVPLWLWAALSAGFPLALPFVARSFASGEGEGALATFNYAWKLVELPLVLAIQLVATLAFPAITRAMAAQSGADKAAQVLPHEAIRAVRSAFLLAWTLACAATAALQLGAPAIATLLFGWGRMPSEGLAKVAAWGAIGAWGLLPQALIAVALTVLASQGRMRSVVAAYGVALVALLVLGAWSTGDGAWLMVGLDAVLIFVALVVLLDLRQPDRRASQNLALLPWQAMLAPTVVLLILALPAQAGWIAFLEPKSLSSLALCALAAISVVATSYLTSAELRTALRR
ncbi:lipid II flippase MurJ [Rhodoferax ferrireducens]|uniref:lipid II flippase MurJ n=1 Tax=Rhodoferax ferrireducens TaxID=192843 RepID=UPI0013005E63|nr:lipid II flippase MurJ [Rhodoferax ferrireducens]